MHTLAPLMLAAAALAQEPVRVASSLSADEVRVGESVVLSVLVETFGPEPQRITVPEIPPQLEVVGRNESRALNASGERTTRQIRIEITLLARLPGRVVIPPASVVVSGVTHRTHALSLAIHGTAGATPAPPLGWEGAELRAWLQPDTVYVGEQALLQVEARIPEGLRRGRARPLSYEPPSPTGFWVHDLPDAGVTVLRSLGDRIIEVQSFRRAYFALDPGVYSFAPARVTYEVRRGFLQPPENQRLESDSLRLVVLPLPEDGRPAGFRGAVGRYAVRARLEPSEVAVGDVASLIVEIEGTGNVRTLAAPELPAIDGVEVHAPGETGEYATSGAVLTGVKRFRWILVPRELGAIEVPPVRLAYFDPETRVYREAASEPVRISVVPGPAAGDALLAPIQRNPGRSAPDSVPTWWLLLLAPPVAIVALAAFARHRALHGAPAGTRARLRLDRLDRVATDDPAAWSAGAARILREAALEAAPGQPIRTASPAELTTALERAGVRREIADEAGDLIGELERVRFAPGNDGYDADSLRARARRILDALARAARALLVLLGLALAAPRLAHTQEPAAFAEGVTAYEAGRFAESADAFGRYLSARPHDATAWYDLGNAQYRAGSYGPAAHAWLRALWIDPRHGAARANLRASMAAAAAAAPPRTLLSRRQAAALVIAAWWIGLIAFAIALRRPHRSTRWAMGGAALIAAGALALATLPRIGAHEAIALEDTPLRLGPTASSPGTEPLQAGTPLDVLERRTAWVRVRDPARREGWVHAATAAQIRDPAP